MQKINVSQAVIIQLKVVTAMNTWSMLKRNTEGKSNFFTPDTAKGDPKKAKLRKKNRKRVKKG